jgi:acyl carrier protein
LKDDVLNNIKNFLEKLNVSKTDLEKDLNVFSDGFIDSMQAIDYLIIIEEKYNINITMQTVVDKKLGKPSDMAKYIEKLLD